MAKLQAITASPPEPSSRKGVVSGAAAAAGHAGTVPSAQGASAVAAGREETQAGHAGEAPASQEGGVLSQRAAAVAQLQAIKESPVKARREDRPAVPRGSGSGEAGAEEAGAGQDQASDPRSPLEGPILSQKAAAMARLQARQDGPGAGTGAGAGAGAKPVLGAGQGPELLPRLEAGASGTGQGTEAGQVEGYGSQRAEALARLQGKVSNSITPPPPVQLRACGREAVHVASAGHASDAKRGAHGTSGLAGQTGATSSAAAAAAAGRAGSPPKDATAGQAAAASTSVPENASPTSAQPKSLSDSADGSSTPFAAAGSQSVVAAGAGASPFAAAAAVASVGVRTLPPHLETTPQQEGSWTSGSAADAWDGDEREGRDRAGRWAWGESRRPVSPAGFAWGAGKVLGGSPEGAVSGRATGAAAAANAGTAAAANVGAAAGKGAATSASPVAIGRRVHRRDLRVVTTASPSATQVGCNSRGEGGWVGCSGPGESGFAREGACAGQICGS